MLQYTVIFLFFFSLSLSLLHSQDPKPEVVQPRRGPRAGGTIITITGTDLDTASKEDIDISVGGVACPVWVQCCIMGDVVL